MSFKEWVLKRYGKDSPYAELASFVHDDEHFPETRSKVYIEAHLHNMNVGDDIFASFQKAWKMYLQFERNRTLPYSKPEK